MSKIDVKKVAQVARLDLTDDEVVKFSKDLESILDAFKDLQKVDTKGVRPAFQPIEIKNVTRPDKKEKCLSQKEALANAKHKENGFFKGPKAV